MPVPTLTDGVYNKLTPDQEYKLKELYLIIMTTFGTVNSGIKVGGKPPAPLEKKGRFGFGSKTISNDELFQEGLERFKNAFTSKNISLDLALKKFHEQARHDNVDRLLLRFLRARKWNISDAANMIGHTIAWRCTDFDVEQQLERGDIYWINEEPDEGFINQYRVGKSIIEGKDKDGRPVVIIAARKHDPRKQTSAAMRRYTLFVMEEARLCLKDDLETAIVIFDLGGFGLNNMDTEVVKFIIECFEAHYPESLGALYLHRAPRIFSTVWTMIKGWLDPVVASKISFTKDEKDLLKQIDADQLPEEIGGTKKSEWKWPEPVAELNAPIKDKETRAKLEAEREDIFTDFEKYTAEWIAADGAASKTLYTKRDEIMNALTENYWKLDPYVRARTGYDRNGKFSEFTDKLAYGSPAQPLAKGDL